MLVRLLSSLLNINQIVRSHFQPELKTNAYDNVLSRSQFGASVHLCYLIQLNFTF